MTLESPQGIVDQNKAQQTGLDSMPELLLLEFQDREIEERLLLALEVDVLQ